MRSVNGRAGRVECESLRGWLLVPPFTRAFLKSPSSRGLSAIAEVLVNFWHSGALALRTERQSARMSKIKNGGLDQYGLDPSNGSSLEQLALNGLKLNDTNCAYVYLSVLWVNKEWLNEWTKLWVVHCGDSKREYDNVQGCRRRGVDVQTVQDATARPRLRLSRHSARVCNSIACRWRFLVRSTRLCAVHRVRPITDTGRP